MAKVKNNYVDNVKLLAALKEYKANYNANPDNPPRIPEYVGEAILKIANNLAKRPNFYGYSFIDECIGDAIENCTNYIHNFDPSNEKQNAFGYINHICWQAFIRRIWTEKTRLYVKYKLASKSTYFDLLGEEELKELDDDFIQQIEMYDNIYEFIHEYENTLEEKKNKIKQNKKKIGLDILRCTLN